MKTSSVENINTLKSGALEIKINKMFENTRIAVMSQTLAPGGDVDALITSLNQHLESNGYAPITVADVERVRVQARAAWTPENISPVTDQVKSAIQQQRDAEAEHAQAIKDAAEREAEANIAKTKAEAAEALAKEATDKANAATQAMNDALAAQAAAEKAAADKKAFDEAVAQKAAELVAA